MGFSVATHSIRIVARRLSLPVRRVKQGLVCVLAVSILVLPRQQAVCQPVYREEVVESAILMSIAKFVEWPAHCFEHADSPLRVCVFGRDLMQKELMKWQGLTFLGRPIEVRVIFDLAELKKSAHRFHILYIADNEWRHTEQIISLIRSLPILSASDDDAFYQKGGIISFVEKDGKTKFCLNLDAAERVDLAISSSLFGLSLSVIKNGTVKET